tara:strand:- start:94 stop:489 length:396 start_codon:yes stop_codon:yes gene_type:complete
MKFFSSYKKSLSLASLLVFFAMQMMPLQAAMLSTTDISLTLDGQVSVERLLGELERPQLQMKLVAMGVDPAQAEDRLRRMTDSELQALAANFDSAPAGGSAGGILLTLFIVFVVTDMLGATDIFPFVKKIN